MEDPIIKGIQSRKIINLDTTSQILSKMMSKLICLMRARWINTYQGLLNSIIYRLRIAKILKGFLDGNDFLFLISLIINSDKMDY